MQQIVTKKHDPSMNKIAKVILTTKKFNNDSDTKSNIRRMGSLQHLLLVASGVSNLPFRFAELLVGLVGINLS